MESNQNRESRDGKHGQSGFMRPDMAIGIGISLILIYAVRSVMTPLIAAWMIVYLLDPLISRISTKTGRSVAVIIIIFLMIVCIAGTAWVVMPKLAVEGKHAAGAVHKHIPGIKSVIETGLAALPDDIKENAANSLSELSGKILTLGTSIGGSIISIVTGFLSEISSATLTAISSTTLFLLSLFYFMFDYPKFRPGLIRVLKRFGIPSGRVVAFNDYLGDIDKIFRAFLKGQLVLAGAIGLLTSIGLVIIKLPGAITIGVTVGLLSLIPYAGIIIGIIIAIGVSVSAIGTLFHTILVAAVFGVVQILESTFLTPKLVGDSVGLHPMVSVLSLIAFAELFGTFGVLLAIPLAAATLAGIRRLTES